MTPAEQDEKACQMLATLEEFGMGAFNAALAKLYGRQARIPHAERLALCGAVQSTPSKAA
jgi:hypothetical protein